MAVKGAMSQSFHPRVDLLAKVLPGSHQGFMSDCWSCPCEMPGVGVACDAEEPGISSNPVNEGGHMTNDKLTRDAHAERQGAPRSRGVGRTGVRRSLFRRRMVLGASTCAVSGLAVAGLGVGFAGPAIAATAQRVVTGTVETLGTGNFTIKSGSATITVDVTSTTKYIDRGVSAPTVANVTAGERVKVRGTVAGTNTLDATKVRVLPALPVVIGRVASIASISSGSFTLTRGAATITVTVSSATTYLDRGVHAPTVANVTAGERVEVFGTETGTDAVEASQVRVLPAQPRAKVRSRLDGGLARLHSGVAEVRGTVARVPVSCSLSSCRGTIRLVERVVSHGRVEVFTLGTSTYGIGRDATTDVLVHLDRIGLVALGRARGHRLLATAVIAGKGRAVASGRLVLAG